MADLRILNVKVVRMVDTDPDLSYLGEYSNTPKPGAIDREAEGDMGRGEYRFFNPSSNYDGEPEEDRDKYTRQDYDRMEAYNRMEWGCVGIRAEAAIEVGDDPHHVRQDITSGGLWGIESDSTDGYLDEIGEDELSQLRDILAGLGFTAADIDAAFAERTTEED